MIVFDEFIEFDLVFGIKGNKLVVYNVEVYIFFVYYYDYWLERFNVFCEKWDWCYWGENIIFCCDRNMIEVDFNFGDVWKIGCEVYF